MYLLDAPVVKFGITIAFQLLLALLVTMPPYNMLQAPPIANPMAKSPPPPIKGGGGGGGAAAPSGGGKGGAMPAC